MTLDWSLILNGVTVVSIALLAADRFVHRIVGSAPLEAQVRHVEIQVSALSQQLEKGNERLSDKMGALNTYLEERRSDFDLLRTQVAMLQGEIHTIRGYRRSGSSEYEPS